MNVRVRPGRLREQRVRDSVPPLWADGGGGERGEGVDEWEGNEPKK